MDLTKTTVTLKSHCCQDSGVEFFSKGHTVSVLIKRFLFCSYAHLDAGHWVAASSPLTAVGTTCGLPSVPCWSTMSAHICGSEYHSSALTEMSPVSSICKCLSLNYSLNSLNLRTSQGTTLQLSLVSFLEVIPYQSFCFSAGLITLPITWFS